jgi:hypothetical protein
MENELSYEPSLHLMLKAVLVSPQFLFITPAGEAESESGIVPLDDYQLASRLSYLLWATMPDDELMALADSGTLHEPAMLEAQVKRMLEDPRSRALFDGFGAQWLGVGDLETKVFDPTVKFPQMTAEMRGRCTTKCACSSRVSCGRTAASPVFVDGDYTFLNETLASIYGLEEVVAGPEMRRSAERRQSRRVLGCPACSRRPPFPTAPAPSIAACGCSNKCSGSTCRPPRPTFRLGEQDQQSTANLTLRERTELHRTIRSAPIATRFSTRSGSVWRTSMPSAAGVTRTSNGEAIDASGELPERKRFRPRGLKVHDRRTSSTI